jgi:ligand-binding sensor domain-containing protein
MSRARSTTRLHGWLVPALVLLVIVGVTGIFAVLNRPESYPAPPVGWQTIRPPHIVLALEEQGSVIWAGGPEGLVTLDRHTGGHVVPSGGAIPDVRYVRDICLDCHGALWIAHLAGVTRWLDGWETVFTTDEGVPSGYAAALLEDRQGNIWVGTETGVAVYDGIEWQSFAPDRWPGAAPVTVIFEDNDGVIWFGSDSVNTIGITRYDGAVFTTLSTGDGLAHNTVTDIIQAGDGSVWVASGLGNSGGATRIHGVDVTSVMKAEGLAGDRARALFEDSRGRLWVTSEWDGVAISTDAGWRLITPRDGLAGWEVMAILEDSGGVLWLGSDNGISRVESIDFVL